MEDFLRTWSYLGVFLSILCTGIGLPVPEELAIVVGGGLVAHGAATFWMLPVCIVAVVLGDGLVYGIGWLWGPRLLTYAWVKKHVLTADRLASITSNFQKHGVKILLFARLTPGVRTPIFLTAGLIRLSYSRFLLADGLYAIPGVTVLFFLGYFFTDSMVSLIEHQFAQAKYIIILVVLVGGYFTYLFLRRPVVTGSPEEVPVVVGKVTHTIQEVTHTLGNVTTRIIHPKATQTDPRAAGEKAIQRWTSAAAGVARQAKDKAVTFVSNAARGVAPIGQTLTPVLRRHPFRLALIGIGLCVLLVRLVHGKSSTGVTHSDGSGTERPPKKPNA